MSTPTEDLIMLQKMEALLKSVREQFLPLREAIEKHFQVPQEMEGDILRVLEFEGRKKITIKSGIFEVTIKTK
jgi:hypothetical protein